MNTASNDVDTTWGGRDLSRRDFLGWTKRIGVGGMVLAVGPSLLAACGGSSNSATSSSGGSSGSGTSKKTITVGGVFSLTGATATYGQSARDGLQTVWDQVNATGGIKSLGGATIHMNVYDAAGSPTTAASQTQRALSEGAVALFGCGDGGAALGATQAAAESGKLFLTGDPTDTITTRGFKTVYQVSPLVGDYISEGIDAVISFGQSAGQPIKSVAIVYEQIATFTGAIPGATSYLQQKGLNIVATLSYPSTQTDFGSVVSSLKSKNPDLILQLSATEATATGIVKGMSVVNLQPKAVVGVIAGYITPQFATDLGGLSNNLIGVAQFQPELPYPSVKTEVAAWGKTNGSRQIDAFGALYITTAGAFVTALEGAKSTDTAKLQTALGQLKMTVNDPYVVIPGGVKFNNVGRNTAATGVVFQYENAKPVLVYPATAATGKAVYPHPGWTQ